MAGTSLSELVSDPFELLALIPQALRRLQVASYALTRDGTVAWLNAPAIEVLGGDGYVGEDCTSAVDPLDRDWHKHRHRHSLRRGGLEEFALELLTLHGERIPATASTIPLMQDCDVVGVFGILVPKSARCHPLSERDRQVLALRVAGLSVDETATLLRLSPGSVRTYQRRALLRLGLPNDASSFELAA